MRILDSAAQLETLSGEWRELWDSDPLASVFQGPDWLIPWTRHLWGGGKLRVATMRRAGRLIGVAPMFIWGSRRLAWLGAGISDYLGITAAPEFADEAAGNVFTALEEMRGEWERCDLEELREDSPMLRAAAVADVQVCSVCPARRADQPLPPRLVKNLRYAERKLGAFEFGPCEWDDLFRLHELRWGGEGVLRSRAVREFHRTAAGDSTRLYGIRVSGQLIAAQYNLVTKGRACYYLGGYDPAWSACSPGGVLLRHAMEEGLKEGARIFDFLRNPEPYKYAWGARDQINRRISLTTSDHAALAGSIRAW